MRAENRMRVVVPERQQAFQFAGWKFGDRVVHHEGVDQDSEFIVAFRYERRVPAGFQIAFHECPRRPVPPEVSPWFHAGKIELAEGSDSQSLDCRGERRVVKRAQHPGNVSQSCTLETALTQRTRRLALEIDNCEVTAGGLNRPEMQ